jgi:hypothetical protein
MNNPADCGRVATTTDMLVRKKPAFAARSG